MRKITLISVALIFIAEFVYAGCCVLENGQCMNPTPKGKCSVGKYVSEDCKDCKDCNKLTDQQVNDVMAKFIAENKGLIICHSNEPVLNPNQPCIQCSLGQEIEGKICLFQLYNNGWELIQVLKTDKGYIYYLDKK